MKLLRRAVPACLLLGLVCSLASGSTHGPQLRMEPARTRVGIARVILHVSELLFIDGALQGQYAITIPLAPRMNDRGSLRLDVTGDLDETLNGGIALGAGHSDLDGRTHAVTCQFEDDGLVRISIDTGDRKLSFRTRFESY